MEKNLERLEFDKILKELSSFCVTKLGKFLALSLSPSNNKNYVKTSLEQTSIAVKLIQSKGNIPLEDFEDIEFYIKQLESGNSLSAKALLDVTKILKLARTLKFYIYEDDSFDTSDFYLITKIFDKLYSNQDIENNIFKSILDSNTIADDASKKLFSLRKNRKSLEQNIKDKLSNFIHSSTYSKYLMDNIITIRDDRFVIPIKIEYKDKISGSILDISASGSTIYLEPSSIYELNNKINNIKAEEEIEIENILRLLSNLILPIISELKRDVYIIRLVDFIFAKAKYSISINGIEPTINSTKYINLINARHPLINKDQVVPIDISIGKNYTSLLITGPNTGGKTASIKTLGLLTLMAESGLHIPVKEGSSIFVFDNIFADIGDEQSIQESISTFSSHILNIVDICNKATSNSLILLDELGSGTDPIEGSSLAISILEYFHNLEALTVATTHYPELKHYALITDGFENASSDFDIKNFKPTYKLLIGVPGKSNAFLISKNLGLPINILDRASSFLKKDTINIELLLKNIYDDKLQIEKEKEKIQKNSNQIELLKKSLEKENVQLNQEAETIINNAKSKARNILLEAKEDANYIIKELNNENLTLKDANNLRNTLNSKIEKNNNPIHKNKILDSNNIIEKDKLKIGQTVFVNKLNQPGTILSLPNKQDNLQIQIGIIKMNINLSEISNYQTTRQYLKTDIKNNKITINNSMKSKYINPEINVIGLNVDQALPIIDKYLDDAFVSGLSSVRIVHGKGTGKLREGIQNFLKHNTHVKNYRIGTFGEGEMGVTIVTLK